MNKVISLVLLIFLSLDLSAQTPVADFTANTTSGCSQLTVSFTDLSLNSPTSWYWDFGNGDTSFSQNPVVIFTTVGTYDILLVATDSSGSDSIVKTNYIDVITDPIFNIIDSITSPTCGFNNGVACILITGGTAPYFILWNDSSSSTGVCADSLYAGVLNPTVSDSLGCSITVPISISNIIAPSIDSIIFSEILCTGDSNSFAQAYISAISPPLTYIWKDNLGIVIGGDSSAVVGLSGGDYSLTVIDGNGCSSSGTIMILEPSPINSAIISSSPVSCYGFCNGSATVIVGGGTMPYSYSWTTGQTSSNASALCEGTHNVTVTDTNGCITISSTTITQPDSLSIVDTIINVSCNGGSDGQIAINVTGGTPFYMYNWLPAGTGGNVSTVTNLSAQTYTVTVQDINGCLTSQSINVTESALISANGGSIPSTCGDYSGVAYVSSVSGGTPGYYYLWDDPLIQTTDSAVSLLSGSYNCTVTDNNGCTFSLPVSVNDILGPSIDSIVTTDVACYGDSSGEATVVFSNGTAPYTIQWNDPNSQVTQTASLLGIGAYGVTVIDGNGCSATALVLINQPASLQIITSSDDTICVDQMTMLAVTGAGGVGGYTWNWSNGLGNSAIHSVSPAISTTYYVSITDSNSCQSDSASIIVFVFPPLSISMDSSISICQSEDVTISAIASGGPGDPYSYLWNNGFVSSQQTITGLVNDTTFFVTVSDGCSPDVADSIEILVGVGGKVVGGTITTLNTGIPVSNSKVYLIQFNSLDSTLTAVDTTFTDGSGNYQFSVSDSTVYIKVAPDSTNYPNHVPTYYDTKAVFQAAIPISFTGCDTLNGTFKVIPGINPGGSGFIGGYINQGAGKMAGIGDPIANLNLLLMDSNSDVVAFTSTDTNGYFSFANIAFDNYSIWVDKPFIDTNLAPLIAISSSDPVRDSLIFDLHSTWLELVTTLVAVNEIGRNNSIQIYPNPSSGKFSIEMKITEPEDFELKVFNTVGQQIYEEFYHSVMGTFQKTVDISRFASGIYTVQLMTAKGTVNKLVIVY